jgi:hypothetical protein
MKILKMRIIIINLKESWEMKRKVVDVIHIFIIIIIIIATIQINLMK